MEDQGRVGSEVHDFDGVVHVLELVVVVPLESDLLRWRTISLRRLLAAQASLGTISYSEYFPLVATVLPQILTIRVQYLILHLRPCPLQQSLTFSYILMTKVALELKLFQAKHSRYQSIHIESVDDDKQQK